MGRTSPFKKRSGSNGWRRSRRSVCKSSAQPNVLAKNGLARHSLPKIKLKRCANNTSWQQQKNRNLRFAGFLFFAPALHKLSVVCFARRQSRDPSGSRTILAQNRSRKGAGKTRHTNEDRKHPAKYRTLVSMKQHANSNLPSQSEATGLPIHPQ